MDKKISPCCGCDIGSVGDRAKLKLIIKVVPTANEESLEISQFTVFCQNEHFTEAFIWKSFRKIRIQCSGHYEIN